MHRDAPECERNLFSHSAKSGTDLRRCMADAPLMHLDASGNNLAQIAKWAAGFRLMGAYHSASAGPGLIALRLRW
jgi:hypothetical protein